MLVTSLMTVSPGHSQRATHSLVQKGMGMVQLGGQADPHSVKSWPTTGQSAKVSELGVHNA